MLKRINGWLASRLRPQKAQELPAAPVNWERGPTAYPGDADEAAWRATVPGKTLRKQRHEAGHVIDLQVEQTLRQAEADSLERQLEGLATGIAELQTRLKEAQETLSRMRQH